MRYLYRRILIAACLLNFSLQTHAATATNKPIYSMPDSFFFLKTQPGNWFLSASLGLQRPILDSRYTISNGSSYAPPSNVDSYSTNIGNTAAFAIDGGYRWTRQAGFIPAWLLGLRYAHSFSEDIGGQITQYSLPSFKNYTYSWDIYSDIFMLLAKVDLFEWHQFLPFVSAGAGVAYNTAANYSETAYAGIDARESPRFARNTKSQLAYSLGLGIDWHFKPAFLASLGYEYQNLGTVSSGNAVGSWAGSHLQSGTYQTSSVMLGLTWLLQ